MNLTAGLGEEEVVKEPSLVDACVCVCVGCLNFLELWDLRGFSFHSAFYEANATSCCTPIDEESCIRSSILDRFCLALNFFAAGLAGGREQD